MTPFRALLPLVLLLPAAALADDELRPLTQCNPFWDAVEALDEFADIDADRRDVVDVRPRPRFPAMDGVPLPDRMFFRLGETERDLAITPRGEVLGVFDTARELGEDAEICVTDPHFAGTPADAPGREFHMGFLPEFLNSSGTLTVAELEKGTKDGRKFFKKLVPGPVSLLVPKFDHVMASHPFDDTTALPRVFALRGGVELGEVEMEPLDNTRLFSLDALEDLGADAIRIEGDYVLYPVPDAKTIRRFMD